jgi:protein SCO1/2
MNRTIVAFCLCLLLSCRPAPLPVLGEIPDFELTAQTGEPYTRRDLDGKVWIADFIFTNCTGPCPRMSGLMRKVQNSLADRPDVRLVSFTVDPERDTPEVFSAYARRYQAREGVWYFLTGPEQTLNMLSFEAFKVGRVGGGNLDHGTYFVLVDQRGRIRGYYGTSEPNNIDQLLTDVRRLCEESS